MSNLNKVMLMGNMTRDPEIKTLPNESRVVNFGMAINRTWVDPESGDQKSDVCFVEVSMFGKRAEVIYEYLEKGSPIYIEGRLQLNQWVSTEGQKRSMLRVVANDFQFIGRKREDSEEETTEEESPEEEVTVEDAETVEEVATGKKAKKETALTQ